MLLIFNLLQSGYYTTEPVASRYDAATMGMFVLIIVIGVIGYIVQARLQHVFKKYSEVPFPGGLTGAIMPRQEVVTYRHQSLLHLKKLQKAAKRLLKLCVLWTAANAAAQVRQKAQPLPYALNVTVQVCKQFHSVHRLV